MAIRRVITAQELPDVDTSPHNKNSNRTINAVVPEGNGWKLEHSFSGEYNLFHVWKQGDVTYDSGFENYWSSKADDLTTGDIGTGEKFCMDFESTDNELSVEGRFIPFDTFIYGGTVFWEGDTSSKTISLEVVAHATTLISGDTVTIDTSTNKLIPSDPTTATHSFEKPTLVDNKSKTGWWDFINGQLIPNVNQEGKFDLYNIDITVARLLNHIDLMPSTGGQNYIKSDNAWRVFPGYKFKFIGFNPDGGTWRVSLMFHLIKRVTVNY